MKLIKLPKGKALSELRHYVGVSDMQTIHQRPQIAQDVAMKIKDAVNGMVELTDEELAQFKSEIDSMIDIKQDHIGKGWTQQQHNRLTEYYLSLN